MYVTLWCCIRNCAWCSPPCCRASLGRRGSQAGGWISCASLSMPMTLRPCVLSLGLRDLCSMLSTVFRLTPTLPTSFLSSICLYVGLCEHSLWVFCATVCFLLKKIWFTLPLIPLKGLPVNCFTLLSPDFLVAWRNKIHWTFILAVQYYCYCISSDITSTTKYQCTPILNGFSLQYRTRKCNKGNHSGLGWTGT